MIIFTAPLLFTGFFSVKLALEGKPVYRVFVYPGVAFLLFLVVHFFLRLLIPNADALAFPIVCVLTSLGLVFIYRLRPDLAFDQLIWLSVACFLLLMVVALFRNYDVLSRYKYTLGMLAILLLASTMVFGKEVRGARLWLRIGPMSFQPSEVAKILLVIFLAAFFAEKRELLSIPTHRFLGIPIPELKYFVPLLIMWGFSILLMIFQKDLGSSLLFFGIFICMLYAATGRLSYAVIGFFLFILGAYVCYLGFAHVQVRVMAWLRPFDPATVEKESFQIAQSLFALSSGKLSGAGLGRGNPGFIPEVWTDFIFSAVGEELGLFGAVSVILLYLVFISRGIRTSLLARDDFGKLLAAGLSSVVALQAFIIIGGVTRLIPLTGITLPFISYGGSSLVANYMLTGFLLCLSHRSLSTNVISIREGGR